MANGARLSCGRPPVGLRAYHDPTGMSKETESAMLAIKAGRTLLGEVSSISSSSSASSKSLPRFVRSTFFWRVISKGLNAKTFPCWVGRSNKGGLRFRLAWFPYSGTGAEDLDILLKNRKTLGSANQDLTRHTSTGISWPTSTR